MSQAYRNIARMYNVNLIGLENVLGVKGWNTTSEKKMNKTGGLDDLPRGMSNTHEQISFW